MTRKDFELIAKVVRNTAATRRDRQHFATAFANELHATNPAFDRGRFIDACGAEHFAAQGRT